MPDDFYFSLYIGVGIYVERCQNHPRVFFKIHFNATEILPCSTSACCAGAGKIVARVQGGLGKITPNGCLNAGEDAGGNIPDRDRGGVMGESASSKEEAGLPPIHQSKAPIHEDVLGACVLGKPHSISSSVTACALTTRTVGR